MKNNLLKVLILTSVMLSYCLASDMRVVIGETPLTESDVKKFNRYGNNLQGLQFNDINALTSAGQRARAFEQATSSGKS